MEIKDKVVAITGASSGIGEATALHLAGLGARVVLGARRTDRLTGLVDRITRAGGQAVATGTDVTRRADLAGLVALAQDRYGRLDVMISNAGDGSISPLDELKVDEWDRMVDVNIKGLLYGIAAALPVFRAQGSGQFVTVASTAAFRVVPAMAVYAGTKHAVRAICEGLRQEAGDSLRVTTVSPGPIATAFGHASSSPAVREQVGAMVDQIAIPADSIARAIAFAVGQPSDVDVSEIVVRPTAQS